MPKSNTDRTELTPKSILKQSISKKRIAHAYLFYGPELSSLLDVALWLAQALNCSDFSVKEEPCGTCNACQKILKKLHPDVSTCVPQGALRAIRIEQIRKIQQEASFKPFEGAVKVQIIQEADCLHPTAANALLKTLEEPPPLTFFILLTIQPEALLATIQSRCQGLQFKPESQAFSLDQFPECENDSALLEALKELSSGSRKRAKALIQEGIWERRKSILKFLSKALKGSWMQMFAQVGSIVEIVEEDLENLESKISEEEGDVEDAQLRKRFEEEKKAFLAGERARLIEEILRLMLAWSRVQHQTEQSFKSMPLWVDSVEESRRYLERGANLRWVLEALVIKLKDSNEY